MFVADAAQRVPYSRQTVYYHSCASGGSTDGCAEPTTGFARLLSRKGRARARPQRGGDDRRLLEDGEELPGMELVWADGAYTGGGLFREWLRRRLGWRLEVPHHPDRQLWRYGLEEKPRGFQVLPRRWVVERTFAWLSLSRRFSKDYERLPKTAEAMI